MTAVASPKGDAQGRTASFMPLNPSTAVAPHERLYQAVRAASPLLPKGEASAKGEGIDPTDKRMGLENFKF
ncbi:MAG: hypothetical protein V7K92_14595 [Nostoc sp.]